MAAMIVRDVRVRGMRGMAVTMIVSRVLMVF
jgi:hypothetical protein